MISGKEKRGRKNRAKYLQRAKNGGKKTNNQALVGFKAGVEYMEDLNMGSFSGLWYAGKQVMRCAGRLKSYSLAYKNRLV